MHAICAIGREHALHFRDVLRVNFIGASKS
jgi:hypothetical protein